MELKMQNKHYFSDLERGYTKLPNKVYCIGLSLAALALLSYFLFLPEEVNPTVKQICQRFNISKPSVYKYIKELEDKHIIEKIETGYCVIEPGKAVRWAISKYKLFNSIYWK